MPDDAITRRDTTFRSDLGAASLKRQPFGKGVDHINAFRSDLGAASLKQQDRSVERVPRLVPSAPISERPH